MKPGSRSTRAPAAACATRPSVVLAEARRRADFDYEEVDIDLDPELRRRYNDEVPVIAINRVKAFKYRVNRDEFLKKLSGARMSLDVLAIAAHPDDVEQTCGGTLIRMAEDGLPHGRARPDGRRHGNARHAGERVAESRGRGQAICCSTGAAICTSPTRAWRTPSPRA